MSKWTNKRRVFVEEYFKCKMNGTEAARRAGFKHPVVAASKLMKVNIIRDEIEKRLAALKMDSNEALRLLTDHARYDLGPYLKFDDVTGEARVDIRALKEAGLTHLIKGIVPTSKGDRVDFVDKQYALNLIMKAHGAYKDVHEVRGTIATTHLTDEQMEQLIAGVIERARNRSNTSSGE